MVARSSAVGFTTVRAFPLILMMTVGCLFAQGPTVTEPYRSAITQDGIHVELQLDHVQPGKQPGQFTEGDELVVRFQISDTTGEPLKSLYPAAWIDPRPPGTDATTPKLCAQKAKTFLSGSIFSKAAVDLNVFYVVVLNRDATVSVVDPFFGFGSSKLLALVSLEAPGDDWAMSRDQQYLYVSMPAVRKIAVIDTTSWKVVHQIPTQTAPRRLALQADGRFLWASEDDGVTAIDLVEGKVVTRIPTGSGAHDLVTDRHNRFVYVSNAQSGTVSVIDARQFKVLADLPTGKQPVSLSYSDVAQTVLVAHQGDGRIVAIDAARHTITGTMQTAPGLRQVIFAPDGRLAFAVNPATDEISIVDSGRNRIIQAGTVAHKPAQVAFSPDLAYILHEGEDVVYMVPLMEIGVEGKPIPLIDFPGAHYPVTPVGESLVTALVPAPAEPAVMFPNPRTETIHYYREGMAAPMGQFKNYSHVPKAVRVLDRSLQEMEVPGLYQSTARLDEPGDHDIVFFMENPRLVHCFTVAVDTHPEKEAQRRARQVTVAFEEPPQNIAVGQKVPVRFRLIRWNRQPITGLSDVSVRFVQGSWHRSLDAREVNPGLYQVDFTPHRSGHISAFVNSPNSGLQAGKGGRQILRVVKAEAQKQNTAPLPGKGDTP